MKQKKRSWLPFALGALAGIAAVGGVAVWWSLSGQGGDALQRWIDRQVAGVLNAYLVPEVAFDHLEYHPPLTVQLRNLKLTADKASIVEIDRAKLTLAEIPRQGQPIRIARVELERPRIQLLRRGDGGFVGLSPFVKGDAIEQPESVPKEVRLSQVLELRHVQIDDGRIVYANVGDEQHAMVLPGINFDLNTDPVPDKPGWYRLAGALDRAPVFRADIDGRINLDTALLEFEKLELRMELGEQHYASLPPDVQKLLASHQVQGTLLATLAGSLPLKSPEKSQADFNARLTDPRFAFGGRDWRFDSLELTSRAANGMWNYSLIAMFKDMRANLDGSVGLRSPNKLFAKWELKNVPLQDYAVRENGQPRVTGLADAQGQARAEAAALPGSLGGSGVVQVRDAQLMRLPIINDFVDLLAKAGVPDTGKDHARIEFTLHPDRVEITQGEAVSAVVALRGAGSVFYDQRLDLLVNAGVLEKIQSQLGKLGELFGKISDRLVAYYVHGTLQDPQITVRPLRLGG